MAVHISYENKKPILYFSLEKENATFANHFELDKDFKRGFYIVDTPEISLTELCTQARKYSSQHQIKIIFVDYFGLISHDNKSLQRTEQLADISQTLKNLAQEQLIPIVLLCQLPHETQQNIPSLADLESPSLEQYADLVLLLHSPYNKKKDNGRFVGGARDLIIAKQRKGYTDTGVVKLTLVKYGKTEIYVQTSK